MGEVNIVMRGKSYGISCDDGQEERVAHMAQFVDSRLRDIERAGAAANDAHLLVLTSLVLADEIHELRHVMQNMVPADGTEPVQRVSEEQERRIADTIVTLANKINGISEKLQNVA